jgi:hypothetical protein
MFGCGVIHIVFIPCVTFLIPTQGHTMPRSDDKVQKQLKVVFGYLWQIHGVCTASDVIITIEFCNWMTLDDVSGSKNASYQHI